MQENETKSSPAQVIRSGSKISAPSKEAIQAELKDLAEKESVMVRGKFIFHELPNGELGFNFRKYKKDPLQKYVMKDGEIYTVPLSVARHLNSNCSYPSYNYKNDEAGRPIVTVAESIRRCSFQSLEFLA